MIHDVIVKKAFNKTYFSVLFTWIIYQFSSLLDTMLSGSLFSVEALTAVGIAVIYSQFVYIFMDAISVGSGICIGNALGRGDKNQTDEYFSIGIYAIIGFGGIYTLISTFFPEQIAFIIGSRDSAIFGYTVAYVRMFGFCAIPYGINYLLQTTLLLVGDKKSYITNNAVFMVVNILASLTYVKIFKMGVDGLALGTVTGSVASLIQAAAALTFKNKNSISLRHNIGDMKTKLKTLCSRALPTFSNNSTEVFSNLVLNNVIGIFIGVNGLTLYTLFHSAKEIIFIILGSLDETVSSTVSVLFGARDVSGIKQVFKSSLRLPMLSCLLLTVGMTVFIAPVLKLFGVDDPDMVWKMLPFFATLIISSLAYNVTYMLSPLYANTDNTKFGIICAVFPDSLICVPIACLLTAAFGINGIWLAELIAYFIFFFILFLMIRHKLRRAPRTIDDLLMLPKEYYDDKEVISISIKKDMDSAVGISRRIQEFLLSKGADKKRAYYAALCTEELSVLIKDAARQRDDGYVDVQVFMNGQSIRLSIRDNGPQRNYLLYEPEDELSGIGIKIVRKISKSAEYRNLIGMNLLNVEL